MQTDFFEQRINKPGLIAGAAGLLIVAGLIHLVIVPIHWAHAPAHGLFFVIMGLVQIGWGIAFWRRPSAALYRLGMVLAGGLITLWVITRLLPAPFEHEPGTIDIYGIICKAAEFLGIALLVALVVAGAVSREMRLAAWRTVGILLVVAIISGWIAYGLGFAIEPALPWLGGGGGHDEGQPGQEHEGVIAMATVDKIKSQALSTLKNIPRSRSMRSSNLTQILALFIFRSEICAT